MDPVVYPLMVGSGPMSQVCDQLRIPVVGFGAGNASSANHAPNENIAVENFFLGIKCAASVLDSLAKVRKRERATELPHFSATRNRQSG